MRYNKVMKRRRAPYFFLLFLILVLVFVGGLRYGQSVERANKVVDYLLSITPSPTIKPETPKPIAFKPFSHVGCGISFIIPESTPIIENASGSAVLGNTPSVISFDCQKKPSAIAQIETGTATASAIQVKGQSIPTKHFTTGINVFTLKNPMSAKSIIFAVSDNYLPLFTSTLQFTK